MKKIFVLFLLLAVLIVSVALAECAGGSPSCNGTQLVIGRMSESPMTRTTTCFEHSNCIVYEIGYPIGYLCASCNYGSQSIYFEVLSSEHNMINR